jgi:hypothetical protein
MKLEIGNIIKSEDFDQIPGRKVCYKIGQVTEIFETRFAYLVLVDIWEGVPYYKSEMIGGEMSTCLPGFFMNDWESRITILS